MKLTNRQIELVSKQIAKELEESIPAFNDEYFQSKLSKLKSLQTQLLKLTNDVNVKLKEQNPVYSNIRIYENSNREGFYVSKGSPSLYNKVKDTLELASIDATDLENLINKVKEKVTI